MAYEGETSFFVAYLLVIGFFSYHGLLGDGRGVAVIMVFLGAWLPFLAP